MIYTGDFTTEETSLSYYQYNENQIHFFQSKSIDTLYKKFSDGDVNWLIINGLNDTKLIEQVGQLFGIHVLVLEDILNTDHLPKLEETNEHLFFTLKYIQPDNVNNELRHYHISFILGDNFLLTFNEKETDIFNTIQDRLKKGLGKARQRKADYLFSLLLDKIVDNNFLIIENLEKDIEDLETMLVENPGKVDAENILTLKKKIIYLKKYFYPLKDELRKSTKGDTKLINHITLQYLNDVLDHVNELIHTIESFRETLNSLMDLYHTNNANKMNNVMMTLTIIATIFIPLTFIAGIYGMNFEIMPELKWKWGYPIILILMFLIGTGMYIYMKKRKWF